MNIHNNYDTHHVYATGILKDAFDLHHFYVLFSWLIRRIMWLEAQWFSLGKAYCILCTQIWKSVRKWDQVSTVYYGWHFFLSDRFCHWCTHPKHFNHWSCNLIHFPNGNHILRSAHITHMDLNAALKAYGWVDSSYGELVYPASSDLLCNNRRRLTYILVSEYDCQPHETILEQGLRSSESYIY